MPKPITVHLSEESIFSNSTAKGLSLKEACNEVVMNKLVKMKGEGGLIAVDSKGNCEFSFNSDGMYRGKVGSDEKLQTYIFK